MDKILIVEDDELVRNGIVDVLKIRNWNTETAGGYHEAKRKIEKNEYMLYILDMMLPDGNGVTLCREIRKHTNNPILFLSAYDSEGYIVEGLEAGGDDYVAKPFRTFELLARIKSLLRRAVTDRGKGALVGIKSGEYFLDLQRGCLYRETLLIELTLTEYRIIKYLMENALQLMERKQLLQIIWDCNEDYVDDNALSVYMSRIRKKLLADLKDPVIETKRGVGYRWTEKTEEVYEGN